jgi:predicted ATPase
MRCQLHERAAYEFSRSVIPEIAYKDTECYQVTKDFLNRQERMLGLVPLANGTDLESN